ncbi:hypothetical protein PanWU01x14_157940 [Parasponia andersonii]|uniref:Uncharacterized protein n=1 Tax=Parasponia andersonii TaxID=3476 RepID=A0A2P5CFC7_PARAD|nr:hypothetical protein PanWU01x14_157940 [Parasponia andersonii]
MVLAPTGFHGQKSVKMPRSSRLKCNAGTHMVFFILNVVEAIGVIMTFKPFLTTPQVAGG